MKHIIYILILILTISCSKKESTPIKLNIDACEFCKMKIADGKFGGELITNKGRVYMFDDMHCMIAYHKENSNVQIHSFYIHDYNQNNKLIPAETAFYIKDGEINSPMHGNIIATKTEEEAKTLASKFKSNLTTWSEIIK